MAAMTNDEQRATQVELDFGVGLDSSRVEIVLSLQDRAFELIRSGAKKFEYRRRWRSGPCLAYVYRSGKTKGLAACMALGAPIYGSPSDVGALAEDAMPGNGEAVEQYLQVTNGGFAIPIESFTEFPLIPLSELRAIGFCPPQYFFYLKSPSALRTLLEETMARHDDGALAACRDASLLPPSTYHFGVYARIREHGALLCVRKTRGPYAGLLDLPGGRPERDEAWREALRRELHEELGITEFVAGRLRPFEIHVARSSSGDPIDFHHRGVVADVQLLERPPLGPRVSADTSGWEWHDVDARAPSELSALARIVGVTRQV
jgi:8-oxo-dGTP pyrophosphatase MutT (NUDIX family)/predicted transcriptional regulator